MGVVIFIRKLGNNMDRSMISMIYFVALLALFLIMIIATIAVIASKSRRRYEEDDDEFEEGTEYEDSVSEDAQGQTVFDDADDMLTDDFYVDNLDMPGQDSAFAPDPQSDYEDDYEDEYADGEQYYDEVDASDMEDESYDEYEDVEVDSYDAELDSAFDIPGSMKIDPLQANAPTQEIDTKAVKEERNASAQDAGDVLQSEEGIPEITTEPESDMSQGDTQDNISEETPAETDQEKTNQTVENTLKSAEEQMVSDAAPEENVDENADASKATEVAEPESDTTEVAEPEPEVPKKQKKKHVRKQKKQPEAVVVPEKEDLSDSAFGPDIPEINISNEALAASVREAEAMGAAIMGDLKAAKVPVETMFGINEELSSYGSKKNMRAKSKVASDEDFYWYNKEDAAERPARRPIEVYYHHFNIADDCIEDLLVEMYDCALVRTEEIRYIAYGIEPRTLSMKEIMSGTVSLNDHKKKEPTEQDLVRIYEKWCGYVDHLLDKVEIHADEYTIQEIRKQLCAYGRNDVDILLEGK